MKQSAQEFAGGAGLAGGLERGLDLAQDLRFAEHHRVEPTRYPQQVFYPGQVLVVVQVGGHAVPRQAVKVAEPLPHPRLGLGSHDGVDLGAVASGQNQRFLNPRLLAQATQRPGDDIGPEGQALADLDRRGLVIQPQGE